MTECILSDHPGVSREFLVTASQRLVLGRLLLEYMNLIILRRFYGKLYTCTNNVYQVMFRPGNEAKSGPASSSVLTLRVYCIWVDMCL